MPTFDGHANLAYSTIATAPSPANSGVSLVVQPGDGVKFPTTTPFNATVWPTGANPTTANAEIVRVTAIATDTFTITRTQEGTSARTILVGDQICNSISVKVVTDIETVLNTGPIWEPMVDANPSWSDFIVDTNRNIIWVIAQ